MSNDETFKLDYSEPGRAAVVSDDERVERVKLLRSNRAVLGRMVEWDQRFVSDLGERGVKKFSKEQQFQVDRIWNQWGGFL